MPTPFPGMDPYLEEPNLWPNVHSSLIVALRNELAPRLRPRYYVSVEQRATQAGYAEMTFATRPDAAIVRRMAESTVVYHAGQAVEQAAAPAVVTVELPQAEEGVESYLEIRTIADGQVVTVLELLSPGNKRTGAGRRSYSEKRSAILASATHLVEIDLLRSGEPMMMRYTGGPFHYSILVSRAQQRPFADLLPFTVRQAIPTFPLPLAMGEAEPQVDLGRLLHELYDIAGYDLWVDYRRPPNPLLADEDAAWAQALLRGVNI